MSFEPGDHIRIGQRPARVVSADTPGAVTLTSTSHHGPAALHALIDHRNRKQRRAAAAQSRKPGRANEL